MESLCPTRNDETRMKNRKFITRIDRYIIWRFLSTYLFLLAIIISIAVIFDFNERIDKFSQSAATWQQIVFDYYLPFIPYFANLFSPLFVFIAVIFFTTKLASGSEIIAMKSAGFSFKRLLRPYMLSAFLIAAVTFVLGAYVIPEGNEKRVHFYDTYLKRNSVFDKALTNIQMQVDTGVVAYIGTFDHHTKRGTDFSLDKFEHKKLVSHLTAMTIEYDSLAKDKYQWKVHNYQIRTLQGRREKIEKGASLDTIIRMEPSDFYYLKGQQETLTLPELGEFIDRQVMRGASGVEQFQVEYHKRFAMPFAAFILTLIGVSLSCEKRKGGMGASIGLGLALSFTYILLQTISATFAIQANTPPIIAAWVPNVLYALIALWFVKRTPE